MRSPRLLLNAGRRRDVVIAALVYVALAAVVVARLACGCPSSPVDERLSHADELVQSGRLLGMTREEAYQLVGEPGPGRYGNWDAAYYLRPDEACIDSVWLVLRFNDDGRVADARILRD